MMMLSMSMFHDHRFAIWTHTLVKTDAQADVASSPPTSTSFMSFIDLKPQFCQGGRKSGVYTDTE